MSMSISLGLGLDTRGVSVAEAPPAPSNFVQGWDATADLGTVADYYVDGSLGSDAAAGTFAAPFQTIQHAVDVAAVGGMSKSIAVRNPGVSRESVDLSGWTRADSSQVLRIHGYGTERAVLSGSEVITGWTQCDAGDATLLGSTLGVASSPVWKVTIPRSDIGPDELVAANLIEDGVQLPIAYDRAGAGHNPLIIRDDTFFHVPSSFTQDGSQKVDTITSTVFGGYTSAQLTAASIVGYSNPNATAVSAITSAAGNTITLTTPYFPQAYLSTPETSFNLVNIMPALTAGQWGAVDIGGGDVTIYIYPTNVANLASGIEICRRVVGFDLVGKSGISIEGFDIYGVSGSASEAEGNCVRSGAAANNSDIILRNCRFRQSANFAPSASYGGVYLRQSSNVTIQNCTFENLFSSFGLFIHGNASGYSFDCKVINNKFESISKSPIRLYGARDHLIAYNLAENCSVEAHANLMNSYEQSASVLFYANRFDGCFAFATFQETYGVAFGMNLIPSGQDGRSIVNQQNATAPPGGLDSVHWFFNNAMPIPAAFRVSANYGSLVPTGSIAGNATETSMAFNNIGSGITAGSFGILDASYNVMTGEQGNQSPGPFDVTLSREQIYVNPDADDFTLLPASPIVGMGGKNIEAQLLIYEAMYGVDLHRDVYGVPFTTLNFIGPDASAAVADVTDPVLSSGSYTSPGFDSLSLTFDSDTQWGGVYWVLTTSAEPSFEQIEAGQDHTGAAASASGVAQVPTLGAQTILTSGLTAATDYYFYAFHEDMAGNRSNILTIAGTTAAAAPHFTTVTGGPRFGDPNTPPASTTKVEYFARINVPSNFAASTIALLFAQESSGCELRPVAVSGETRWTINLEDGAGTNMVSTSGAGLTGIALPIGTWFDVEFAADLVAGTALLKVNGVTIWSTTFTAGLAYFQTARKFSFLAGFAGGNPMPAGILVEYGEIWFTTGGTRSLRKRIAGDAATVNADPWKLGSNAV